MRFMMIAKADKRSEAGLPPSPELIEAIGNLTKEIAGRGILVGMGGLAPSSMGARLRVSGGKVTVTDGPFTETKDIIGGYAIVDVESKEEAIELGRRFLQVHADILGPDWETESEIRLMFPASAECGGKS